MEQVTPQSGSPVCDYALHKSVAVVPVDFAQPGCASPDYVPESKMRLRRLNNRLMFHIV